jgi:hypothetical protein
MGGRQIILLVLFASFYMVPGAIYLLCAIFMRRRRTWAIILALVLASLQCLLALIFLVGIAIDFLQSRISDLLIPAAIELIFFLAFAQLIYHLIKSFDAIKYAPVETHPGFEPLPVQLPPSAMK